MCRVFRRQVREEGGKVREGRIGKVRLGKGDRLGKGI